MKKQLLFIIYIFSFLQQSFSQNPLVKQWDYRYGGTYYDLLHCIEQTVDGGYILGGYSLSGVSGDKTQPLWNNSNDYWIIKIDSLGNKEWDKDFGGFGEDYLTSLQQTTDGGYILSGYSNSGISGDKTEAAWGGFDYWIVKTDSLGNKQWDKDFGGILSDILKVVKQTSDGGYILGGSSLSDVSGDKTQLQWGNGDYWIIKTDSLGIKQWDKDFGGTGADGMTSMQQTIDGGYILAGYSASGITGNKTQASWGFEDYWIVKIDSLGNQLWDKDFGGTNHDFLFASEQTSDSGFIFGGRSLSGISGDKSQPNWDTSGNTNDFWIVKTNSLGIKQWDKDFGGSIDEDDIGNIFQTADNGYLIAGTSYSPISGDKTENNLGNEQSWIIKTDSIGIKQWDKTLLTNTGTVDDEIGFAIQTKDGCYAMANYTVAGIGGDKTQPNWDISENSNDFWLVKFCDSSATTSIAQISNFQFPISVYPNPANEYITINYQFKAGDEIQLTDVLGKLLFTTKIKTPSSDFRLPTSDLSPGIYFIKAGNDVRKFVKE